MPKKFPLDLKGFNPFGDLIGLKFTGCENGWSRCVLEVDKKLFNPHGVLHGAVIYAMADTGMGAALYTQMMEDELCSTVEVKINYFSAVTSGTLVCDTRVIFKGEKIAALESEVKIGEKLVAKAYGTYYIFKMKG